MNENQKAPAFPTEFGIMAGFALVWSGQFMMAIVAIIAWFVLRGIRPATPSAILLVTAINVAETLLGVVAMVLGYASFGLAVEIAAVLAISLFLFFTHARHWAFILVIHAGYVVVMRTIAVTQGAFEQSYERIAVGAIAVRVIIAWLLISFIRQPLPVLVEASETSTGEDSNAKPL